jgi:arylsulfatase A-like enzyme
MRASVAGAFGVVCTVGLAGGLARGAAPNIVVLLADDLGYGDLGCYGHPTIATPNLDRMAREGLRLTSFYAAPACTPSRAMLLTGRYAPLAGLPDVLGPDAARGIAERELTLAEALKGRGYRTLAIGKWHVGHAEPRHRPLANGFDAYFGLLYSNDMTPPWVETGRPLELWRDEGPIEHPVDQSSLTARYTDEAVRFIRKTGEEPFFLYLAYTFPHVPLHASERFRGRSRAGLYGDVVEEIDWSAGRIIEALREAGLEDRTLVIFTSDNGPWSNMPDRMFRGDIVKKWDAGSAGLLRGAKGTTFEGGVRVPCIARWPGRIPGGRVSGEMASMMDLFATALALAGAVPPADRPIDGVDIRPLLSGTGPSPRRELLHFLGTRLEAVREGRWKLRAPDLVEPREGRRRDDGLELFDLEADPGERFNVAAAHPELVERLGRRMAAHAAPGSPTDPAPGPPDAPPR